MTLQFPQGQRGGVVGSISFAGPTGWACQHSLRMAKQHFSQGKQGGVGSTVVAGPAGLGWQHSCRRTSEVGFAVHLPRGQWGGVGSTVGAGPAGWGRQRSFQRASGVLLAARFSQSKRGWGWQHSFNRASMVGLAAQFFRGASGSDGPLPPECEPVLPRLGSVWVNAKWPHVALVRCPLVGPMSVPRGPWSAPCWLHVCLSVCPCAFLSARSMLEGGRKFVGSLAQISMAPAARMTSTNREVWNESEKLSMAPAARVTTDKSRSVNRSNLGRPSRAQGRPCGGVAA